MFQESVVRPKSLPSCYVIRLTIWEALNANLRRGTLLQRHHSERNFSTEIAKSFSNLKKKKFVLGTITNLCLSLEM